MNPLSLVYPGVLPESYRACVEILWVFVSTGPQLSSEYFRKRISDGFADVECVESARGSCSERPESEELLVRLFASVGLACVDSKGGKP